MESSKNFTNKLPSYYAQKACEIIKTKTNLNPIIGIVLGSGMGNVATNIENPVIIPYNELPGFSISTVEGHAGNLIIGTLNGVPVACLQGRVHLYEGGSCRKVLVPIYTMKMLGCKFFLATTAVGSLRNDVGPGSIVSITDHINMQGSNPLVGLNDLIGPRFPSLLNAYDLDLKEIMHNCALQKNIKLNDGVYLATTGPSFETPAEIRAFKILGADVVGMSLVGEIIAARHCGLKCAALSIVVNFASGLTDEHITHEETLHYSKQASSNVSELVLQFVESLNNIN